MAEPVDPVAEQTSFTPSPTVSAEDLTKGVEVLLELISPAVDIEDMVAGSEGVVNSFFKGDLPGIGLSTVKMLAGLAGVVIPGSQKIKGAGKVVGREIDKSLWGLPEQKIKSADTSINKTKLPALFKRVEWSPGTVNADIGGGKFDNMTEALRKKDVENVIFDPFNRSAPDNALAVGKIAGGKADTATISNVLNVVKEKGSRRRIIAQAADAIRDDGTAYFHIHQGSGTGVGKATTKGWQENRKAESYIKEIKEVFPVVRREGKLLIAEKDFISQGKALDEDGIMDVVSDHGTNILETELTKTGVSVVKTISRFGTPKKVRRNFKAGVTEQEVIDWLGE